MNNARRKLIEDVVERLDYVKGLVEGLQIDEQDAFEAMPEGLQASERGQMAEASAECLQSAFDAIEEAQTQLQEASA